MSRKYRADWGLVLLLAAACGTMVEAARAAPPATPRSATQAAGPSFTISFPALRSREALDGRLILLLSRDFSREPREHVNPDEPLSSPFIFGLNVEAMAAGKAVVLDDRAFGWPARKLSDVPPGEYFVQVVLNRYETYRLADGRVLKLPPDKGEGQQWTSKPGNLYSTPLRVRIDPAHPGAVALSLAQEIGPIAPKD